MNEKRAWEVVWKKSAGRAIAFVLLCAMRQPLWLRIRLAWTILKGARHDATTTDKEA